MNNFTPRAQQVLALARKKPTASTTTSSGPSIFARADQLGQGVAVNVLQKMGLDLETVRMEVEKQVGAGPRSEDDRQHSYTPRVKKVLALASKEAKALNHTYVGTEHPPRSAREGVMAARAFSKISKWILSRRGRKF